MNLGPWEIVLIILFVIILFGGKKTARTGPGIGVGLKEFKQATREIKDEVQNAADEVNGDEKEPQN